jgi:hypothetical protein
MLYTLATLDCTIPTSTQRFDSLVLGMRADEHRRRPDLPPPGPFPEAAEALRVRGSKDQRIRGSEDQRIRGSEDQRIRGSEDHCMHSRSRFSTYEPASVYRTHIHTHTQIVRLRGYEFTVRTDLDLQTVSLWVARRPSFAREIEGKRAFQASPRRSRRRLESAGRTRVRIASSSCLDRD